MCECELGFVEVDLNQLVVEVVFNVAERVPFVQQDLVHVPVNTSLIPESGVADLVGVDPDPVGVDSDPGPTN